MGFLKIIIALFIAASIAWIKHEPKPPPKRPQKEIAKEWVYVIRDIKLAKAGITNEEQLDRLIHYYEHDYIMYEYDGEFVREYWKAINEIRENF